VYQVETNTNLITSFKQYGTCVLNYIDTIEDLAQVEHVALIGAGSNILIKNSREVFKLSRNFEYIHVKDCLAIIGGSTHINLVIKELLKKGFYGLEFLAGVPASIGGCVKMNAGAFGKSIQDVFEYAICYSFDKGIHTVYKDEAGFGYRMSNFKDKIILEVALSLTKSSPSEIEEKIRQNINKRLTNAHIVRTFGSVFKNPKNYIAGKLIEECGLKGTRINDAMISLKHANYIINLGKATVDDVLKLIDTIKTEVYKAFNIELEEEVIII